MRIEGSLLYDVTVDFKKCRKLVVVACPLGSMTCTNHKLPARVHGFFNKTAVLHQS
jgi:hypothetical protein